LEGFFTDEFKSPAAWAIRPADIGFNGRADACQRGFSAGSLKFAHHFGLTRFSNLGEQLTLQDSVTHSNKTPVDRSLAPLDAADLAAGLRLREGT
jgi:hypothetical protein